MGLKSNSTRTRFRQNTTIRLHSAAHGRDNNFNLIRFCAANAVLISHAWPISLGPHSIEPLESTTGHTMGELAVYVFFALSGFLIAGSFERSRSPADFILARMGRLFPGLAASLVFVAFTLGPLVTTLPALDYLSDPNTFSFLARNVTLIAPQYTLPGVFTDLPYPTVEGSIWTLAHEVACYFGLFILGLTGVLSSRVSFGTVLIFYACLAALPFDWPPRLIQLQTLSFPFLVGTIFWVWRGQITLSVPVMLVLVAIAWLSHETRLAFPTLILALSYTVFWLGYAPSGAAKSFNRFGDYSYGIYIYAFPMQGLAIWLWGPMGPLLNIALSLPMVLLCAVASWHWIERPALDYVRAGAFQRPVRRAWR
ncbi:acyltransferase family protein [uncultured Sulfitobacter sp.]|uniref:acyltransferase family protein n=1 Tax=Sulfitobacter sp. SH22 TaxID=3421172 RepID=UPI0025F96913|nr:acyltransferase [uncultured Sulfitobacter sp.]